MNWQFLKSNLASSLSTCKWTAAVTGLSSWPRSFSRKKKKQQLTVSEPAWSVLKLSYASWLLVVHVDLCTNRSGLDNSTHQSRPHNPFLKDRTNGRQQSGRTAQHGTTTTKKTTTQNNKRQERKKKHTQTYKVTKRRVYANNEESGKKRAQQNVTKGREESPL